jgi:hypothetical protein
MKENVFRSRRRMDSHMHACWCPVTTNNANTAAKVLNVMVEFKVEITIRFITLKMILLFSVYIGCFTGTAKIIREIMDVLVLYNIILSNDG